MRALSPRCRLSVHHLIEFISPTPHSPSSKVLYKRPRKIENMDTGLTNLGPLPTNFAVNSNCARDLNDVYKYYTTPGSSYFLLQGPVEQTSCYPSSYTANSKQYYSPARCPTGFTSACESHNSAGTIDETVVRCCPTYVLSSSTDGIMKAGRPHVLLDISRANTTLVPSDNQSSYVGHKLPTTGRRRLAA